MRSRQSRRRTPASSSDAPLGDVVIVAQRGIYAGKPRPAVVVQAVGLDDHPSVLVCLVTSADEAGEAPFRVPVAPAAANGLERPSLIQADRIETIRRDNITRIVGRLDEAAMETLNTALALFQGLA